MGRGGQSGECRWNRLGEPPVSSPGGSTSCYQFVDCLWKWAQLRSPGKAGHMETPLPGGQPSITPALSQSVQVSQSRSRGVLGDDRGSSRGGVELSGKGTGQRLEGKEWRGKVVVPSPGGKGQVKGRSAKGLKQELKTLLCLLSPWKGEEGACNSYCGDRTGRHRN